MLQGHALVLLLERGGVLQPLQWGGSMRVVPGKKKGELSSSSAHKEGSSSTVGGGGRETTNLEKKRSGTGASGSRTVSKLDEVNRPKVSGENVTSRKNTAKNKRKRTQDPPSSSLGRTNGGTMTLRGGGTPALLSQNPSASPAARFDPISPPATLLLGRAMADGFQSMSTSLQTSLTSWIGSQQPTVNDPKKTKLK